MSSFRLEIVTPRGSYFQDFVQSLTVDTEMGYVTILRDHLPLVAPVRISQLFLKDEQGETHTYAIGGGLLQVKESEVVLLLDSIESPEEIDLERAELAAKRAKARLEAKDKKIDIYRAEAALHRALNRMKVKNDIK